MMNLQPDSRLTHAMGWVCPDGQLVNCAHAPDLINCLTQHHPHLAAHQHNLSLDQFLHLVYSRGYTQVSRCCEHVVFEHGTHQRPDTQQMHQLVGHVSHRGDSLCCRTQLYHSDLLHTRARRRFFRDT